MQPTHTVIYLIKDDKILLGEKKTGFGKGYLVGMGGKLEAGESSEECVIRETQEEAGVKISNPEPVGMLKFNFLGKPGSNQIVDVYRGSSWEGEPVETEEIIPDWHDLAAIPYSKMWDDNFFWLPIALDGRRFSAEFDLGADNKTQKFEVTLN